MSSAQRIKLAPTRETAQAVRLETFFEDAMSSGPAAGM
jgi:hypothetical protein